MLNMLGKKFASVMEMDIALEHFTGESIPSLPVEIEGGYLFKLESGNAIELFVEESPYEIKVIEVRARV